MAHASATPASSAAPLRAPAEVPTTKSKQAVSPSRSIAAAIPAETTPRIPPPSSARAKRAPSERASVAPAAARRARSSRTGWRSGIAMQHFLDMLHQVESARLNILDELYLHLDREQEPWTVHVEIRAQGRIEGPRLIEAVREAARRHPLARARLADGGPLTVGYRWEIGDELGELDLDEVSARDGAELAAARERLLSRPPRLDRPGPFALLLAHRPGGDTLVLSLHHAAGDGLSALRLMGSIARAYGGEEDPLPEVDPLGVRDVLAMASPGSLSERLSRARAGIDYLTRGLNMPSRVAPRGGEDRPGYGFELTSFAPDELAQVAARRAGGATVNDVLLAGLAVTIRRWNERLGADANWIYVMMPINLRPPHWRFEVVGNFASYVSVRLSSREHATLEQAIPAIAERTREIKEAGVAGLIVELFAPPRLLPSALKQRMQDLIPLTGNLAVDTSVLSNLGRIESVPGLGEAGAVRELWFSPPGRMPLGASFGAATLGGRLFLALRYRHAQFDAPAAGEFADLYRDTLLSG